MPPNGRCVSVSGLFMGVGCPSHNGDRWDAFLTRRPDSLSYCHHQVDDITVRRCSHLLEPPGFAPCHEHGAISFSLQSFGRFLSGTRPIVGVLREDRPDHPSGLVGAGNDNLVCMHAPLVQFLHERGYGAFPFSTVVECRSHAVDQEGPKVCVPPFRDSQEHRFPAC